VKRGRVLDRVVLHLMQGLELRPYLRGALDCHVINKFAFQILLKGTALLNPAAIPAIFFERRAMDAIGPEGLLLQELHN